MGTETIKRQIAESVFDQQICDLWTVATDVPQYCNFYNN